LFQKELVNAM